MTYFIDYSIFLYQVCKMKRVRHKRIKHSLLQYFRFFIRIFFRHVTPSGRDDRYSLNNLCRGLLK